ncbi:MAG: site-specific DNA-methyltransferase [Actinobacteria bacterium]|nr:site-specific DNA-methyltransferase [Actinomycetota bacterium]
MVRLDWAGREDAVRLAESQPRRKLRRIPELSSGVGVFGNAVIQGDNLQVMTALAPTLQDRVNVAFLDPPYNATREYWVYPDRVRDWYGTVVGAEGEDPLRHDKWLSMMYPRLVLLRTLLARSGTLFVTLDDHEVHHARVLLDEIFGPENFLANLIWEKSRIPDDPASHFLEAHTHLIAYAKDSGTWRPDPSADKIPTIWSAAEVGDIHETMVEPHDPGTAYPFVPKPVELLRRILWTVANRKALVFDPFAGTGTTGRAVLEQNASDGGARTFVLVEADEKARTRIPRRLAESPGGSPGYDFYALA